MDIVEFAEKFLGTELKDWQKEHLRRLDNMRLRGPIRVVMRYPDEFYIYLDQTTQRELIQNGQTPHCYH